MMKIYRDGKAFPCCEADFERCIHCHYVIHHLDELLGIADCTPEVFYRHHGNQPLIYPTMMLTDSVAHWNGLLHFTTPESDETPDFIHEHADELNVVLAFDDPYTRRFHFIIDTHADDLSTDNFYLVRKQVCRVLRENVADLLPHHYNFYVRALPERYYEILDRDALFGQPE